jgi:hydrogenase maturation factor
MSKEMNGQDVGKMVSKLMNNMNSQYDEDLFVNEILSDHRTIQQKVCGLMLRVIVAMGDSGRSGRYDARNEMACKISEKLLTILEEEYIVFRNPTRVSLPFI